MLSHALLDVLSELIILKAERFLNLASTSQLRVPESSTYCRISLNMPAIGKIDLAQILADQQEMDHTAVSISARHREYLRFCALGRHFERIDKAFKNEKTEKQRRGLRCNFRRPPKSYRPQASVWEKKPGTKDGLAGISHRPTYHESITHRHLQTWNEAI